MNCVYLVVKHTYGDFDIPISQTVAASMDENKQREIASQGGKAAHEKGTAHEFSSEEAREAGRKGGQNSHGGGRQQQ